MSQFPDYRSKFTDFFSDPTTYQKSHPATFHIVRGMNNRMAANNVPMTKEHYDAATSSILKGDTVCSFMIAENPHVMKSTGSGVLYNMGKAAHTVISKTQ